MTPTEIYMQMRRREEAKPPRLGFWVAVLALVFVAGVVAEVKR